ncbi:zinc finger SWIM domain-containing protein 8-like [Oppia nitens]|uniref:zinc finger SWIM domain-containing protein 8-like n=1 Tax=Oppia nitens TaxID=1686743 RepID=UPI0023DBD7A1|nr:zinc finger SWIM domain-containing protein 8-like [Oppia nitens]
MFDWEEGDRFSFEDSERFEEDSLCSWMSEPESVCNNWRGWKKSYNTPIGFNVNNNSANNQLNGNKRKDESLLSLVELSAQAVACHIPFEVVEHVYPPVPEQLQLRIAFWSFPENEEDIRLYSCLANGSADEFQRGENLLKAKAVKELLQIGFHLSATVTPPPSLGISKGSYNVAVTFDRRRITSCNCTCPGPGPVSWCSHVVSVCLFRIHQPTQVCLRAPVSESLSRLHRDQLQKFAQYLISELPQQILPTAQRLLDELLSNQLTAINTVCGAPDPTAGASVQEQTKWCLDESQLHENIRKILIKLCVPSPIVFSDVNYLSSTAPPAAAEWSSLLRPLRGREPEGMWNLLSIVREMLRRSDRNAIPLLEILTEEVLACDQIILWWFNTKVLLHAGINGHGNRSNIHSNTHASQHACSSLCDEVVILWRLVALNPALSPSDAKMFYNLLHDWHLKTVERVLKMRTTMNNGNTTNNIKKSDIDVFTGFKPAMEGCLMDWSDYPIAGITYFGNRPNRWYTPPVHASTHSTQCSTQTISTENAINSNSSSSRRGRSVEIGQLLAQSPNHLAEAEPIPSTSKTTHSVIQSAQTLLSNMNSKSIKNNESNRSSLSSEGFCETENEAFDESIAVTESVLKSTSNESRNRPEIYRNNSNDSTDMVADENGSDTSAESNTNPLDANSNAVNNNKPNVETNANKVSNEFDLYYYNSKANENISPKAQLLKSLKEDLDENRIQVVIKRIEDPIEILFARAEALHAHGRTLEACLLAVKLADELLSNPPNLLIETPTPPTRGKRNRRFNPICHQVSLLASATLSKAAFLCSVLGENTDYHYLAFKVGLFGLEMARPPASTKALEVKLANQEQDLVALLKRIPLSHKMMQSVREKAEQLRDGILTTRGDALLPLMLASYIFDALVLSSTQNQIRTNIVSNIRLSTDEKLGFEAAVAALGLKANVSEAEHPLLCEGTRRQRGELALTLLVHYKDDQQKLHKIMDKLLDKEVHQMYRNTAESFGNTSNINTTTATATPTPTTTPSKSLPQEANNTSHSEETESTQVTVGLAINGTTNNQNSLPSESASSESTSNNDLRSTNKSKCDTERNEEAGSPCWDEDYKAWEARFRCTNFRTNKKHSVGMASIDSSAPETTSSDNSPTVVRRSMWVRPGGPGSDSGSSGESSDSFSSSSSGDKAVRIINKGRDVESPKVNAITNRLANVCTIVETVAPVVVANNSRTTTNGTITVNNTTPLVIGNASPVITNQTMKAIRFKGKRAYPSIPNQPSEASAHFMFELAKTVLVKAGGNSTTAVLFTQPSATQNCRGPHRALHMCAFQIGVYALGLHNTVSLNWLSRTYSSHVSWITGQAMEIGNSAINFLIETWEGHLTPPEVASLADRASRGRELSMVKAAAELALSCLPHAHALNPNEIQRALIQCKEQSNDMLERACLAVESAAKGGGVYPEVLFEVARKWYELYEENLQERGRHSAQRQSHRNIPNIEQNINGVNPEMPAPVVNNINVNSGICMNDQNHMILQNERQQQYDPMMANVGQPSNIIPVNAPQVPTSTVSLPMMPPLNCGPTGPFTIPPHPYGYYQSLPPYSQQLPPFQYVSTANTCTPYPYPFYPNSVTSSAPLPHLRNIMPPILFQANHQQLMPSINVTQNGQQPFSPRPHIITIASSAPHPQQALHMNATVAPHQQLQQLNTRQLGYLLSAYRVGMLAMETLARRVHDDRPQAKYARNPSYGEDVKWLLNVAKKLGTSYLQDFCICTVNSVASPFVLHEIVLDTAQYLTHSTTTPGIAHPIRSHLLTPLIQKCQQMFIACTHFKMYHITPADYDEFVTIIRSARSAFQLTPGGNIQFNELLQSLRRSKSCKKDLWQHIANSLQTTI